MPEPLRVLLVGATGLIGRTIIAGSPVARSRSGRPTSTRHMRHMPTGSILGW